MKNNITLIGRIGIINELKTFEDGNRILNLSIAIDESYKNKEGEKVEKSFWMNLTASNTIADLILKHFEKGDQLAVSGKIVFKEWENNGEKKSSYEVAILNIEFLACRKKQVVVSEENIENN